MGLQDVLLGLGDEAGVAGIAAEAFDEAGGVGSGEAVALALGSVVRSEPAEGTSAP